MDFTLLDEALEQTLKEFTKKTFYGVLGDIVLQPCEFSNEEINALVEKGYLRVSKANDFNRTFSTYTLTHNGKHYFENKEKFLTQKRKAERKESRRYWITTSIAICALAIAIIALFI